MRVLSHLLLLSGLLTAACGPAATSETEHKAPTNPKLGPSKTPAVSPLKPAPSKAPTASSSAADSLEQAALVGPQVADSMRAYWGSRPMRFGALTAPQLTDYGIDAVPDLGRRVRVGQGLYQLPRFYYHPAADTSQWVQPEAIADVILFLASPAARGVTGALIPVTRGG